MYRSHEDTPFMRQYRQDMSDCVRLPRCYPVAPNGYDPSKDSSAMMGAGRGGGGGGHGGGGRGGFRPGGHGRFPRGGGGAWWGGPWWYGPGYVSACDLDPLSYECFLEMRSLPAIAIVGNGTDYYSRVQAQNLFPRLVKRF